MKYVRIMESSNYEGCRGARARRGAHRGACARAHAHYQTAHTSSTRWKYTAAVIASRVFYASMRIHLFAPFVMSSACLFPPSCRLPPRAGTASRLGCCWRASTPLHPLQVLCAVCGGGEFLSVVKVSSCPWWKWVSCQWWKWVPVTGESEWLFRKLVVGGGGGWGALKIWNCLVWWGTSQAIKSCSVIWRLHVSIHYILTFYLKGDWLPVTPPFWWGTRSATTFG